MDGYWIGSVDGWEGSKESSPTSTTQQRLLIDQLTPKMKSVYHAVLRFYSGLVLPDYSVRDIYIKQSTSVRKAHLAQCSPRNNLFLYHDIIKKTVLYLEFP